MPLPVQGPVVEALIRQRRLSSRDAAIARQVDPGHDPAQEARLLQSNLAALQAEISRARDPRVRAVLMDELAKLQPQNLVGPARTGDMLRPAEGPQVGQVFSDSQPRPGAPISYGGEDEGINQPAFSDPRDVAAYEQRNHGVYYPPHGGLVRYSPGKM